MIEVRPRASLYHAKAAWFSANWHFSFDSYVDERNTQWGTLRVFNDDRLVPGAAWPMHPHRDVEGITYVAEGTFEHADSLGNDGVLGPGSVQRMTLGSGALHSERNHSTTEPMRFIQMWIMPATRGLVPSVEQRSFPDAARRDRLLPVVVPVSGYGSPGAPATSDAVHVHQDAAVYAGLLGSRIRVTHRFRAGFGGYFFVVHGEATIAAADHPPSTVDEGGAAKLAGIDAVAILAGEAGAEVLLVEIALDASARPPGTGS